MCMDCQKVFDRHFGRIRHLKSELLWSMTCFPFGDDVTLQKQLNELAAVTKPHKRGFVRRVNAAMKRQEAKTTRILREIRERENAQEEAI